MSSFAYDLHIWEVKVWIVVLYLSITPGRNAPSEDLYQDARRQSDGLH